MKKAIKCFSDTFDQLKEKVGVFLKKKSAKYILVSIAAVAVITFIFVLISLLKPSDATVIDNFVNIDTELLSTKIVDNESAVLALASASDQLGYDNALDELEVKTTSTIYGDTYYRMQQYYEGIPVYGRTIVVCADENGKQISITGNVQDIDPEIQMNPAITQKQIEKAISKFIKKNWNLKSKMELSLDPLTDSLLCIYDFDEISRLVYVIDVTVKWDSFFGMYEFVVDAQDAEIIDAKSKIVSDNQTETAALIGQKESYKNIGITNFGDRNFLLDFQRQIQTYNAINDTWIWKNKSKWAFYDREEFEHIDLSAIIDSTSLDLIDWNKDTELDAPEAVDAYVNTQIAYDYYDSVLSNKASDGQGNTKTKIVTGISYVSPYLTPGEISKAELNCEVKNYEDNAFNVVYTDENGVLWSLIAVGNSTNGPAKSAYLDVMAHEYTHSVNSCHSDLDNRGESGAISEGLADIFGELVEAWHYKSEPDWVHGDNERYLSDPSKGKYKYDGKKYTYPTKYMGEGFFSDFDESFDNGGRHINSTVISHAAYLMYIGNDSQDDTCRLNTNELAQLWYRAMLMMPYDCTFSECRTLVEIAAKSMNLSDAQCKSIASCFDTVGITRESKVDYIIKKGTSISVFDINELLCGNYTVIIEGFSYGSDTNGQMYKKRVESEHSIYEPMPVVIDLDKGEYTITLRENYEKQFSFGVIVDPVMSSTEELTFYTDFGYYSQMLYDARERYAAYLKIIDKLTETYGEGKKINDTGLQWVSGLAIVRLIDLNKDGIDELLCAYSDKDTKGVNKCVIYGYDDGLVTIYDGGVCNIGNNIDSNGPGLLFFIGDNENYFVTTSNLIDFKFYSLKDNKLNLEMTLIDDQTGHYGIEYGQYIDEKYVADILVKETLLEMGDEYSLCEIKMSDYAEAWSSERMESMLSDTSDVIQYLKDVVNKSSDITDMEWYSQVFYSSDLFEHFFNYVEPETVYDSESTEDTTDESNDTNSVNYSNPYSNIDIIGTWYNDEGRYLDVRSNGTFKHEHAYGLGSWRQLDDGRFIFLDYYGEDYTIEIGEDDKGLYIKYFSQYRKASNSVNDSNSYSNIDITGTWYNDEGRYLDVRSNGTFKHEHAYGLGSWHQLDDGRFIFLDYYGEDYTIEIGEDDKGLYIKYFSQYRKASNSVNDSNSYSNIDITGTWYNDEGRYLDVRSDGTFKHEYAYGLGSWHQLDDGRFIFLDYYGEDYTIEIGEDDKGIYIKYHSKYYKH